MWNLIFHVCMGLSDVVNIELIEKGCAFCLSIKIELEAIHNYQYFYGYIQTSALHRYTVIGNTGLVPSI